MATAPYLSAAEALDEILRNEDSGDDDLDIDSDMSVSSEAEGDGDGIVDIDNGEDKSENDAGKLI